jgi:hypothetical protein
MDDLSTKFFMFFPKCAPKSDPNGILGVEGTVAYDEQNCH